MSLQACGYSGGDLDDLEISDRDAMADGLDDREGLGDHRIA
jgi:hypothetical protein